MLQEIIGQYSQFPEFIKNKTFLVTGASGFIGTHTACMLILNGINTVTASRSDLNYSQIETLYGIARRDIKNHYQCSIYDRNSIISIIRDHKPDILINLAFSNICHRDMSCLAGNISGEIDNFPDFIESISDIERIVFIGTCEEYGLNPPPFSEDQKEDPISVYSLTKTLQYYIIKFYLRSIGKNYIYLRPFTTYGPMQNSSMFVSSAIISLLKDKPLFMSPGYQKREFNFVTDIAHQIILAAIDYNLKDMVMNIGSGISYQIRDMAYKIRDFVNSNAEIFHDDNMKRHIEIEDLVSDNTLMRSNLGNLKTGIETGLKLTIEYYRRELASGKY